jgi:hypothetical protein
MAMLATTPQTTTTTNLNNNNNEPQQQQRIASIAGTGKWFIQKLSGYKIILHASQGRMQQRDGEGEDDDNDNDNNVRWKTVLRNWFHDFHGNDKEEGEEEEEAIEEETHGLLKWCASLRFVHGAVFLVAEFMSHNNNNNNNNNIALLHHHPKLGRELWHCFIAGHDEERCTQLPESPDEQDAILQNYTKMSEWPRS